jgi:hypothetical protein
VSHFSVIQVIWQIYNPKILQFKVTNIPYKTPFIYLHNHVKRFFLGLFVCEITGGPKGTLITGHSVADGYGSHGLEIPQIRIKKLPPSVQNKTLSVCTG